MRMRDRDEAQADALLVRSGGKSKNHENANAYAAYTSLPNEVRISLLRAVTILDGSPNIIDVRDEIVRDRNVDVVFRFAHDSPLEGDGFELPVPREMTTIFGPRCVR
jgi:hypothetical protein